MSDPQTEPATPIAAPAAEVSPAPATKKKLSWWEEIKGIFWLILAVLGVWSFIAKPFFIPSESMMPTLLKGDRLVVTKFPYGWSYISPSFHVIPFMKGRLFGRMPERGDVVIVTPPGQNSDYIKRVVGLPGDRIEVRQGNLIINGTPVKRVPDSPAMIPIDANTPCDNVNEAPYQTRGPDGKLYCALPRVRETLPNGRTYETIDLGYRPGGPDDYAEVTVPANHVFLMGDNRDESADSRVSLEELGLGGPVPWENLGGRAELITFSYDGQTQIWNPISWFTTLRAGRAGLSLHPTREGK